MSSTSTSTRDPGRRRTALLFEGYWKAGILEYWLVDARKSPARFDIYRHTPDGYVAVRRREGWLKSAVFDKQFRFLEIQERRPGVLARSEGAAGASGALNPAAPAAPGHYSPSRRTSTGSDRPLRAGSGTPPTPARRTRPRRRNRPAPCPTSSPSPPGPPSPRSASA